MKDTETAYVGLGSNQGDSRRILEQALESCSGFPGTKVLKTSAVYITEPREDPDQPWFYNQVAALETKLEPEGLLEKLQELEVRLGRIRTSRRYGPRTLDLDILLYGGRILHGPRLIIPHPRMLQRAFVLAPLNEVAPGLTLPDGSSVEERLKSLDFSIKGDKIYQKD